jgi:hypothetical protein
MRVVTSIGAAAAMIALGAGTATAQSFDKKGQYEMAKNYVIASAKLMPEANYGYQPTPEVRTFGQLIGHVANSVVMICVEPMGGKSPLAGDAEKLTTKADLVKAVSDAFAACDKSWATEASGWSGNVAFFGGQVPKVDVMTFNTAHTMEHYGNIITYLRLKGLVPPSSAGGR